jgi:transposase
VTLQQLWIEYREAMASPGAVSGAAAYSYSQFCDLYAAFRAKVDVTMRQVHRAGEKIVIDYSGKKLCIWSPSTGEAIEVEFFVTVLGASNYTHAEATRTQQLEDFCASTVRAFKFIGGVPKIAVPDQLRSAVSGPDRYDPEINPTYAELAEHYSVAIVPARVGEPRDKANVIRDLATCKWIKNKQNVVVVGKLASARPSSQPRSRRRRAVTACVPCAPASRACSTR